MVTRDWEESWAPLRSRRVVAAVAIVAAIPLWFTLRAPGLLLGFALLFLAYRYLRSWACPRCQLPIVGVRFTTFPERCVNCGLLIFGHVIDIEAPFSTDTAALRLSRGLRRTIAGYEIAAGAILMILTLTVGGRPFWFSVLLEGLAGLSLAGGVWLWGDDERGYQLSRILQVIQLVGLQSPWLTYVAVAGAALEVTDANGSISINPAIRANFNLAWMPRQSLGVTVNLWAAMLFLVLLHARTAAVVPMPSAPDDVVSLPADSELS